MKKSIVALLAASAVVALTGAAAVAAPEDIKQMVKGTIATGENFTVSVSNGRAGCDAQVKVKDQTDETENDRFGSDWYAWGYTNNTVALGNIKVGTKGTGSTKVKAPAKAGYYEITSIVKLSKLSCVPFAGSWDNDYRSIGTPIEFGTVQDEDSKLELVNFDLQTYNYKLNGQVRVDGLSSKYKAGVGVELWMVNISGDRWVKVKSTKSNALGEFKFEGVYVKDAHDTPDYQIRIVRDTKFYGVEVFEGGFHHFQEIDADGF